MADRSRIDWVDASINPFGWGCYGPGGTAEEPKLCGYCYAKRLSRRKLRSCPDCRAFIPHWHKEELDKPLHWRKPRRVFVGSMTDPFGSWVTAPETEAVFNMMAGQSRHTFYLLTKQPESIPLKLGAAGIFGIVPHPNIWLGASVDLPQRSWSAFDPMQAVRKAGWHTFASVEPIMAPIDPNYLEWAEWVIVGALTGPGAADNAPERGWIVDIIQYADERDIPIFLKSSITALWPDLQRREWPEEE